MKLRERIDRWAASRGHGVHSPLAFRLVEHVVRPSRRVVYYGEERLKEMPGLVGTPLRRARFLLRLVAELQPSRVWMSPNAAASLCDAVRFAGEVIRIFDGKLFPYEVMSSDLVVLDGGRYDISLMKSLVEAEKSVVGFGWKPEDVNEITDLMQGGVFLNGVESFIMINHHDGQLHKYNITKF